MQTVVKAAMVSAMVAQVDVRVLVSLAVHGDVVAVVVDAVDAPEDATAAIIHAQEVVQDVQVSVKDPAQADAVLRAMVAAPARENATQVVVMVAALVAKLPA